MEISLDMLAEDLVMMKIGDLRSLYYNKITKGTTIRQVVDALKMKNLLQRLVRSDWRNDGGDKDGLYLIREGNVYQVFMGERGVKNWLEEFADLESAAISWADLILSELGYLAPDSKIG